MLTAGHYAERFQYQYFIEMYFGRAHNIKYIKAKGPSGTQSTYQANII